ncbi:MAG: hypothetical protein FJ191_12790 [Gammaproteobacteria bacterium]|nr:hypothetical protein [Gammaproteobacteria bacterium]
MNEPLYVAIDQGGHATRALAFDRRGRPAGAALVTIATQHNELGHVEHDADELVTSVTTVLEDLARHAPPARWAAAGLAVQRSSIACWDRTDGRPLAPVISWQDRRNAAWLRGLARQAERVHELTGLPLSPHYGASKLRWCLDHVPAVRAAAAGGTLAAGPLASFLLYRLLSERPLLADAANAARTQLWSPFERDWSAPLLELFGVPRSILPRATGTAGLFGHLAVGDRRVPLTVCSGDQSVVPFAAGPLDPRTAYVNLGTGAFVLRPSGTTLRAPPLLTSVIRADATRCDSVLEGTVNGAGAALGWLEETQGANAARLLALLESAPLADPDAPFFLNGVAGLGSPYWQPDFESRFIGTGSEPQQCRAVLESVAFLVKVNLDTMDRTLGRPYRIVASGGLADHTLLCRMLAALAGVPVERAADREATARGLARLVAGEPEEFAAAPLQRLEPEPEPTLLARYLKWLELMRAATGG